MTFCGILEELVDKLAGKVSRKFKSFNGKRVADLPDRIPVSVPVEFRANRGGKLALIIRNPESRINHHLA